MWINSQVNIDGGTNHSKTEKRFQNVSRRKLKGRQPIQLEELVYSRAKMHGEGIGISDAGGRRRYNRQLTLFMCLDRLTLSLTGVVSAGL